jgi:hypothetical protein
MLSDELDDVPAAERTGYNPEHPIDIFQVDAPFFDLAIGVQRPFYSQFVGYRLDIRFKNQDLACFGIGCIGIHTIGICKKLFFQGLNDQVECLPDNFIVQHEGLSAHALAFGMKADQVV